MTEKHEQPRLFHLVNAANDMLGAEDPSMGERLIPIPEEERLTLVHDLLVAARNEATKVFVAKTSDFRSESAALYFAGQGVLRGIQLFDKYSQSCEGRVATKLLFSTVATALTASNSLAGRLDKVEGDLFFTAKDAIISTVVSVLKVLERDDPALGTGFKAIKDSLPNYVTPAVIADAIERIKPIIPEPYWQYAEFSGHYGQGS